MKLSDDIGQLTYKVWYFASLKHDEDQRDNQINARRQQVQILFAKANQACAWFNPELLQIPLPTVQQWLDANAELAVYRFSIEDLYQQQEHVLDEKGEHLLSLASRFETTPNDAYSALSTADVKHPVVTLSTGEVTLTYGQYRAILATNRLQSDRRAAFEEFHRLRVERQHLRVALPQRPAARLVLFAGPRLSDDAGCGPARQQHPDGGREPDRHHEGRAEPLRRYHRLRKRVLGLDTYHNYDTAIPLVDFDRKYPYEDVLEWLPASVKPLGQEYERQMRRGLASEWIDVYESRQTQWGVFGACLWRTHMLLNYTDTLDAGVHLAHEMGHSMHTLLSHAHQPFVYSAYTIFVAEVPSTLSEMLFLDYMLERATDDRERIVLLQHAIDGIVGTFYTQVLFADYELQAHRLVEEGRPVTAEGLGEIYFNLLELLRRRARLRRAVTADVGAYPALLQHPYVAVPVRDLPLRARS
jgi:oligoendopeptidase F